MWPATSATSRFTPTSSRDESDRQARHRTALSPGRANRGLRPAAGLRPALGVLAAMVVLAVPGLALGATGDGGVRVTINGDPGPFLSHDALLALGAPDQPPVNTTSRVNGHDRTVQVGGTTARNLVSLAGVGLPALLDMSVSFVGSSAPPVTLSADEVSGGFAGDPLGTRFATFDAGAETEVRYFQPLRSPTDAQTYSVDPPGRTDLLVNLHTRGHRLTVHLTPSSSQSDAGQTVNFAAQVDPAPSGPASYEWDFEGNGQPSSTQVPQDSHAYGANGTYRAAVTVTTRDGSSGTDSAVIQVGHPASGGTSSTPSQPAASLGGGGTPAGGGTPKNGGGTAGPTALNVGPAHSSQPATARPQSAAKANAKATATPAATTPATPAAAPVRSPTTGRQPPPQPAPGGAARPARVKPASPGVPLGGTPVRGILLADSGALADALPALARSTDATAAPAASRAAAGSPTGLLGWLAVVGLCLGLLLGGALRELRPLTLRALRSV